MKSRRVIVWALVAGCSVAAVGCSSRPKNESVSKNDAGVVTGSGSTARGGDANARGSAPATQPQTVTIDPQFNQAEALARKTQAYSQQVTPMLQGRGTATTNPSGGGGGGGAPGAKHDQRDSTVQWGDPDELSLGSASPSAPPRAPAVQPQTHQPMIRPNANGNVAPPRPGAGTVTNDSSRGAVASLDNGIGALPNAAVDLNPAPAPTQMSVAKPASGGAGPAGSTTVTVEGMSSKLDKRVRDYPRDVSAHLDLQLMKFLLDEQVPDLASISSLPTEDRELVSAVIDGLSNFRSTLRQDNNMLLSKKVRPLLEMADRLRSQADLTIPVIALCTAVRTYGQYDPIEPARFAAGKEHEVILYCEIENLAAQFDDKKQWTTRLTKEATLYTEGGTPVWSDKLETITDVSRHRRHDFFIVKRVRIPATLGVGRYLLKVSVVDQQVSRVAEATVPVVIAAQ